MAPSPSIDPLAEKILQGLRGRAEAGEIVLGGYVALQHHVNYRVSHDLVAWWRHRASPATEAAIRATMEQVAAEEGCDLQERRFGETTSFELRRPGRKRFSFQIAVRSVEIESPVLSAWPPVLIETIRDNVGSKMNALVDRGAPRDFLDIQQVVQTGLLTTAECWTLWTMKNPGDPVDPARQKVLYHLTELEQRRPLEQIADAAERIAAEETRAWFKTQFLQLRT